jgi:hypothetical protein
VELGGLADELVAPIPAESDASDWWTPSEALEGLSTMGARGQPTKWDKWYSTARWARIRKYQLPEHPLCKYCLERAIVTPEEPNGC